MCRTKVTNFSEGRKGTFGHADHGTLDAEAVSACHPDTEAEARFPQVLSYYMCA